MTLALVCAGVVAPSWGQGADDDIFETLVRGLEHRQTLVTCISGEAVEETFLSQAYWQGRLNSLAQFLPQANAPSTERYDRGSFLVRFDLREQAWDYEAQALIWPGGLRRNAAPPNDTAVAIRRLAKTAHGPRIPARAVGRRRRFRCRR